MSLTIAENRRIRMKRRREREPVRDIREDLRERLNALEVEMALAKTEYETARRDLESNYMALIEDIGDRHRAVRRILDFEGARLGDQIRRAPSPPLPTRIPLVDYILHFVGDVGKCKEDIKDAVDSAGYEGAGRTVHTTLLNMVRAGRLRLTDDIYRVNTPNALATPTAKYEKGPQADPTSEPLF